MKKLFALMIFALMIPSAAVAHDDDHKEGIEISKVWARKTSRTVSAAVYLEIKNNTHQMIELTGASTAHAKTTMIHQSYEEDSVMKMDHVMKLPIAPDETVHFRPGGYHVMLMGLTAPLKEGEVFPLTLEFDGKYERDVIVEVTGMMGRR